MECGQHLQERDLRLNRDELAGLLRERFKQWMLEKGNALLDAEDYHAAVASAFLAGVNFGNDIIRSATDAGSVLVNIGKSS